MSRRCLGQRMFTQERYCQLGEVEVMVLELDKEKSKFRT